MNQQIKFGIDTIASLPTPIDTTIPANATNGDKNTAANPGSMTTVLDSTQNDGSGNSVNLTSSGVQALVVYQDLKQEIVEVKIHRKPRRDLEPAKDFQLRLFGFLPSNSIKKF
ncbi:hypothetical protein [Nostoc sp.]|uniref:hypothetical protein n=1 Tax=Nostoc sp. TaxID=1180 RepID=UPI002FF93469